ncbi:very long chain fatty acid elongase 7-like [Chironomus tepperi]|uniref:very long chain fatty acid elongase 7-like n=1 Tax=Chironomus tepperi TaxID=113505 RepID=UPI00391EF301
MDNHSDKRTSDWFLMSSPFPTMTMCLFYVYIVKNVGPKLMENQKPFKLRKTLIVYNLFQAVLSFYLFFEEGRISWLGRYSWRCQPIDFSQNEFAMRMVRGSYIYYISKFIEFFDTFFFILRKRFDQVSTLHVIHHGIMPFSVWWGVKFMPGGHSTFFAFLNTFVHVVMYTYYMIAAIGPEMQKYLWWKKYLTILQMIQFVLVLLHSMQLLFDNPCNVPMSFVYFIGGHAVLFLVLFANFYNRTYSRRKEQ